MPSEKLIILDANNLAHIAKHSCHGLSFGEIDTGVIFGFLRSVRILAKTLDSGNMVFVWDSSNSKRKKLLPSYKGNRRDKEKSAQEQYLDASAAKQFILLQEYILPKLGFRNNFQQDGYEADDLVAVIVKNEKGSSENKIVVSSDEDMFQLLDHCCIWLPMKKARITRETFIKLWGVEPKVWIDVKCIAGCSSDNIPGVTGVGTYTAIKYLTGVLTKGKTFDLLDKEGKALSYIADNEPLVKLPFPGTAIPEIKKYFRFKKRFIQVFDEFGLSSFLRDSEWAEWVKLFNLE
uniref:Putative exonuclease n=1 Tax=viral metagenome TaxID=1070528 RepID=A0A6M3L4S1_9ZZZZ